jgi:HEAT repeat protein
MMLLCHLRCTLFAVRCPLFARIRLRLRAHLLRNPSPAIRVAALDALRGYPNVAQLWVLPLLKDEDQTVQAKAIQVLGYVGDAVSVDPLIDRLGDPTLGAIAVESLARIRQMVSERLVARFSTLSQHGKMNGLQLLGYVGDAAAVDSLIDHLDDPTLGPIAVEALVRVELRVVDRVLERFPTLGLNGKLGVADVLMRRKEGFSPRIVGDSLATISTASCIPALTLIAASDSDSVIRSRYLSVLEVRLKGIGLERRLELAELLDHPDCEVRQTAAFLLGSCWDEKSANGLRRFLKDSCLNLIRWKATHAPRQWVEKHAGSWNEADWLALIKTLKQSSFWPMDEASIVSELEAQKLSFYSDVRAAPWRWAKQLDKVTDPLLGPVLCKCLDGEIQKEIQKSGEQHEEWGNSVVAVKDYLRPALWQRMQYEEWVYPVVAALGRLREQSAVPLLAKLLHNLARIDRRRVDEYGNRTVNLDAVIETYRLADSAVNALVSIGSEEAISVLREFLSQAVKDGRDSWPQRQVETALNKLGDNLSREALIVRAGRLYDREARTLIDELERFGWHPQTGADKALCSVVRDNLDEALQQGAAGVAHFGRIASKLSALEQMPHSLFGPQGQELLRAALWDSATWVQERSAELCQRVGSHLSQDIVERTQSVMEAAAARKRAWEEDRRARVEMCRTQGHAWSLHYLRCEATCGRCGETMEW